MNPRDCVGFGWGDFGRIINPLSSPLSPIGQARGIYNAARRGPGALVNPLTSPFSPFGQTRALLNVFKPGGQKPPMNYPVQPDMYYPPQGGYQPPMQGMGTGAPVGFQYAPPTGAPGYDWGADQQAAAPIYDWSQYGIEPSGGGWEAAYGQ